MLPTDRATAPAIHGNNLTALRWLAAGLVLYGHAFILSGRPEPHFMGWLQLGALGVYIFFSISGYLVAQSWERDPHVLRFLARRALRIFPGLAVCIVLTIIVLGPLLTTLPVADYLHHPATRAYLSNIWLQINYHLPGLFQGNHHPGAVNGSLWSLPLEFALYVMLAGLGLLRLFRTLVWVLPPVFTLTSFYMLSQPETQWIVRGMDLRQLAICGSFFWVGALYQRLRIERYFTVTALLGSVIVWLMFSRWLPAFAFAGYFILPFLVLGFGLARSRVLGALNRFDYSYGIYIYAFPLQQAFVMLHPGMSITAYLLATAAGTLVLAALSWHLVEKPALGFKPGGRRSGGTT